MVAVLRPSLLLNFGDPEWRLNALPAAPVPRRTICVFGVNRLSYLR